MAPLIVESGSMSMKRIGTIVLTLASGFFLLVVVLATQTSMFE
jgi:hypothetical protein